MRRERGFFQLAGLLAGVPGWFKVAFWVGIAIVILLLALSARAFYRQWQGEVESHAKTRGEFSAFTAAVKARGEEAQRETDAKDRANREYFNEQKRLIADADRRAADALRRLRERPPARPDGSAVPVASTCTGDVPGPASERVPLEDYRALEERAFHDARRLREMSTYIDGLVRLGVLRYEDAKP